MNILALDSSSSLLTVSLKCAAHPILEKKIQDPFHHLENLLPAIDFLVKKRKISISKIDTILIGRGPGSFTGVRIGFGTLKGLLAAKNRDCYGAISLDLIAENTALPEKSKLWVCLDARREKIYTRAYIRNQKKWNPATKPLVLNCEELIQNMKNGDFLTGDALERYQTKIKELFKDDSLNFLEKTYWFPKSSTMISWFLEGEHQRARNSRLLKLKKPADFIPLYFRLSEPEEKRRDHAKHA